MKIYKLILIGIVGLLSGACDDKLTDEVQLDITVASSENVKMEGNVITVKKGEPINFLLSGKADFISFFSGEKGAKYINRERTSYRIEDIKSTILSFDVKTQYGESKEVLKMFYSNTFPGISKSDFEADSVLVEKFEWKELVPQADLPQVSGASYSANIDLLEYLGQPLTFAIYYKQLVISTTVGSPRFEFSNFKITNTLQDGSTEVMFANRLGLTPLNMLNKWNIPSYDQLGSNREYGTVTNNQTGLWSFTDTNLQHGFFSIHSGWTGDPAVTPLMYSWLLSTPMTFNVCDPDQGTKVKDSTMPLTSHTYTYNKVGIYDATFLARNVNVEFSSEQVKHLVINVVE